MLEKGGEGKEGRLSWQKGTYVSTCGTNNTIDDSSPSGNETRTGSDGYETSNDTGAETNSGPLALKTVIQNTPGDASNTSSQVGDHGSHDRTEVGSQCGTGVESEPTNPQEDGSDDNVCDVVRAVVQLVSTVATTLAQHDRVCEGGASR